MSATQPPSGNLPPAADQAARAAGQAICQSGQPSPELLRRALDGLRLNETQWAAIYQAPAFSPEQRRDLQNASGRTRDAVAANQSNRSMETQMAVMGTTMREQSLRRTIITGELSDDQVRNLATFVREQFQTGGPLALSAPDQQQINRGLASYDNPIFRRQVGKNPEESQKIVDAEAIGLRLLGMNTLDQYLSQANNCPQPATSTRTGPVR